MTDALEQALDVAFAANDLRMISDVYEQAAHVKAAAGDNYGAGFLLTQAWVYALEAGDPRAVELRARLIAQGRESEQ